MGWKLVYCPRCGTHQEKIEGAEEVFFCTECCREWVEDRHKKKRKKTKP